MGAAKWWENRSEESLASTLYTHKGYSIAT